MRAPLLIALLALSPLAACSDSKPAADTAGQTTARGPTAADFAKLETLVSCMAGAFDSAEQSKADSSYFEIHLHMTPIWTDRTDGRWLYVEQAMSTQLNKPYRQRVYHVSAKGGGLFTSEVSELPGKPLDYAGAWKNTALLKGLTPETLIKREGCTITLTERNGAFIGGTHAQDCASNLRGAAYATSEVTITPDQLLSWDRGFDAEGKQVWGAVKGGYIFRKRAGAMTH